MKRVHTEHAPAAIGPYSQAICHDGLVYASGQISLPPGGSGLIGTTAATQAEGALRNLAAVLAAAGSDLQHTLKVNVFLEDMADFPAVNAVYAAAFGDHRPARATVAVRTLPKNAKVEIDCVAVVINA